MKELFIERRKRLLRIAVRSNNKLEECYIEEENNEAKQGQLYKGIVKNIIPAIKCAFIDIGIDKNCYMYLDRKFNNMNIKKNDEVIVEVLKESIGEKGPKVTSAFALPGRYTVLETINNDISFSSKLKDNQFKKQVLENIYKPIDIGVKIRTNAEKVSVEVLNDEIHRLLEIYNDIVSKFKFSNKPKLLYEGEGILDKILRDKLDSAANKIYIDNECDFIYIKNALKYNIDVNCDIELFEENRSLLDYFGIEKEIIALRNNKVHLVSGGHIVIDKTEGMYVIDVNSGRNVKNSTIEKTAYYTNLEAAIEIGRQIKLRNLSGIIVVDFIDMVNMDYKEAVISSLKKCFENDKNKTLVFPFTELNLAQIARKRIGKPILEYIEEGCEACKGKGIRLKFSYLIELIGNEIVRISKSLSVQNIFIQISTAYKQDIYDDLQSFIEKIKANDKKVYMEFVEKTDFIKVEPLIFNNHIEKMQKFKIYG